MPEHQSSTAASGEMTQRFIEFVMMQAQQAAMFLGRGPRAGSGRVEVSLDYARLFIDQLEMIREKTKGNLTKEETDILTGVLSDLQMTFVEVSAQQGDFSAAVAASSASSEASQPSETAAVAPAEPAVDAPVVDSAPESSGEPPSAPEENRKRFSKSYG